MSNTLLVTGATGLPPMLISAMIGFDVATALGFHAPVTPAGKHLTGHEPTSVGFLAAKAAALFPTA
jgi:NAD(P)H dehydrogenase (quinone)